MHRTIYLVRHATYSTNPNILPGRLPVPLSPEGEQEAQRLHEYFKDKNIAKIYSSAVLRCKQTSEIISGGQIPIEFDKRLLEGHSAYQGYLLDNDDAPRDHFYTHLDELGGETRTQIQNRVADFFEDIKTKDEGNIIISSHGDPLFMIFLSVNGEIPNDDPQVEYSTRPDYPPKGSVRILEVENGKEKVGELVENSKL